MKSHFSKLSSVLGALAVLGLAAPAFAVLPPVSSSPDTDAFRTGGSTAAYQNELNAIFAQFSDVQRVFVSCYTGGGIKDDGSQCDGNGHGAITNFSVIQGTLRDSNTDPNGLGVPNGPSLGTVTYRVGSNGSSNGVACAVASPGTPGPIGFLAPEGFDGVPNTADDAGGSGTFGTPGPGTNPGTTNMSAAPLTNCQGKTNLQNYAKVAGTTFSFTSGTNTELCVVNFDLNGNGSIANDQTGAALPGAITTVGQVANNETTNLKLSCDTGLADLPPADFSPPKNPFNQQLSVGAQAFAIKAGRDVHSTAGGANAKVHLNMPQIQQIFGEPAGNSACSLNLLGATGGTNNLTACIRASGSGTRETTRLTFMVGTQGTKTFSEDPSGAANGTTTTCIQTKEGPPPGSQVATKRVKQGNGTPDVVNCLDSFQGAFGYTEANFNDPGIYATVIEGVDTDAALASASPNSLKDLMKCGLYRFWGPLTLGNGAHNPGGSAFITSFRSAMLSTFVFAAVKDYLPLSNTGFTKSATDGSYSLSFIPTTCPAAPPAEIPISSAPNS